MAKTITLNGHNYTLMTPSQAQRAYRAFERSDDVILDDVYGRCSRAKERAYEYCRDREREMNSYNGVITGHNTCTFSYAFTGWCEGKQYFVYITKDHDYARALEDF